MTIPNAVMMIEHYNRLARLLTAHVPVTAEINIETKFTGDHEHGFDTVAEIPGTDPKLKDEVVMVGGHLDSWISGTGATDNGAGSVMAMEAVRILKALGVQPRRTIRIALWSGEEEGLFGSVGYVTNHFGKFAPVNGVDSNSFSARQRGPLTVTDEWKKLDAYYNLDNGTGRVRGIYTQENWAVGPIFKQWIAPLADLGVTHRELSRHRRYRSPRLRRRRPARLPVHPGPYGLRDAHAPLGHGYLRSSPPVRSRAGRDPRSHLPLEHQPARRHDAAQAVPAP